jgi:hypothetical protein
VGYKKYYYLKPKSDYSLNSRKKRCRWNRKTSPWPSSKGEYYESDILSVNCRLSVLY